MKIDTYIVVHRKHEFPLVMPIDTPEQQECAREELQTQWIEGVPVFQTGQGFAMETVLAKPHRFFYANPGGVN